MAEDKKFNPKVADKARQLIGQFIKERRDELGWSQQKLADMADIRKATLIDVEAGRTYNMNTLLAILGCLRGKLNIEWQDIDSMPHFGKPSQN
jgi:transcriptional regulator with XRE-family HTH domain